MVVNTGQRAEKLRIDFFFSDRKDTATGWLVGE